MSEREVDNLVRENAELRRQLAALSAERAGAFGLRHIVDANVVGAIVVSASGQVLEANDYYLRIIGYTREELEQGLIDWRALTPPEWRAADDHAIAELQEHGTCKSFEKEYLRRDGSRVSVIVSDAVLPGPDTNIVAFVLDITERKQIEAERQRLMAAIEQAAETILITDAQGCIVYANPAFETVTGYARSEVLGKNPRFLKSGLQDEAFYRSLWETICAGKTWHGRLINLKKDGTRFTEDATISPVRDAGGAVSSFVAVKRDVTRDLALEAQLFQAQKMEGIGRLAGGVAHDFNNLLSVILSYTGFAIESIPEGDPIRDDLHEVRKAGERAASLTRQLVAFSRKQVLQPEALDLNKIVTELEKLLRRVIGEDVELVKALVPDLGLVRADPGQVEQVIMNLAVNARDAMPGGGRLTIETANVELDADYAAQHQGVVPGAHIMVAVGDTGVGMDEQTLTRIFEPFFTTKAVGKGTGLGLSTVYGIIRQSGGSVHVESELGRGTTFKVFLPRMSSAGATVPGPVPVSRRATGIETILVVDDEEALRKVAKRTLEASGFVVLTAATGDEALLLSARHAGHIPLLLTDMVMPRMGGKALAAELVKTRPTLRVLYMSGYMANAIAEHGELDEGAHFIGKPFSAADLHRKVHEVLAWGSVARDAGAATAPDPGAKPAERALDADALRAVPREELDKLRKAVVAARYDEIVTLLEALESTHPHVAVGLRRMADAFDYAGIRYLLRE